MKAELKFDLDNAEDERALKRAIKSVDLCLVIFDIQSKLYSLILLNVFSLTNNIYI
jgi:hypothetical protein